MKARKEHLWGKLALPIGRGLILSEMRRMGFL